MKKIFGISIFGGIEIFTYFYLNVKDMEMFFMVWSFIALLFVIYNIFSPSKSFVGANPASVFAKNMAETVMMKNRKSNSTSLYKIKKNIKIIIYLMYFLINLILFIFVVYTKYYT
ncbi:MAG: hypothetical protein FH751_08390 [Firmicutes bacterium]|nr:hypothetical protein [Bacillota bacterium]